MAASDCKDASEGDSRRCSGAVTMASCFDLLLSHRLDLAIAHSSESRGLWAIQAAPGIHSDLPTYP